MTPRLYAYFEFIEGFIRKNRWSPSMKEIAAGVGVKSLSSVHKAVHRLENMGYLSMAGHMDRAKSRSIAVTPRVRCSECARLREELRVANERIADMLNREGRFGA